MDAKLPERVPVLAVPECDAPFAAAVSATRMPMIVTDPHQPDNPIIFVNDAFVQLSGYGRDELLGQNCRFLQGPGTNPDDITKVRNAIARRESIEIDLLNYRKDGTSFWNRLLVSPVFNKDGELTHFCASQFDVSPERNRLTELSRTQNELEVEIETRMRDITLTESRLRFILNAARMGTWTLDLGNNRLITSAHCRTAFGRRAEDTFSYDDLIGSIHPDDLERWQNEMRAAIDGMSDFQVEYRLITPMGETRWVDWRGHVACDENDVPTLLVGVSQNITQRKEAEEYRKILARELVHRVKNSLATAQAIFTHSLKDATDLADAKRRAIGRIQAMSSAQDMLNQDGWTSADLRLVVEQALQPFRSYDIRIAGPRIVLDERGVSALSFALYELATNSLKYGALSAEKGSVTIAWTITDPALKRFKFHWSEMNGPTVVTPTRRGFGSTIIEEVTAIEMNGVARMMFNPGGLLFELDAPVPEQINTAH